MFKAGYDEDFVDHGFSWTPNYGEYGGVGYETRGGWRHRTRAYYAGTAALGLGAWLTKGYSKPKETVMPKGRFYGDLAFPMAFHTGMTMIDPFTGDYHEGPEVDSLGRIPLKGQPSGPLVDDPRYSWPWRNPDVHIEAARDAAMNRAANDDYTIEDVDDLVNAIPKSASVWDVPTMVPPNYDHPIGPPGPGSIEERYYRRWLNAQERAYRKENPKRKDNTSKEERQEQEEDRQRAAGGGGHAHIPHAHHKHTPGGGHSHHPHSHHPHSHQPHDHTFAFGWGHTHTPHSHTPPGPKQEAAPQGQPVPSWRDGPLHRGYAPAAGTQGVVADLTQGFGMPALEPRNELEQSDYRDFPDQSSNFYRYHGNRFPLESAMFARVTQNVGVGDFGDDPPGGSGTGFGCIGQAALNVARSTGTIIF